MKELLSVRMTKYLDGLNVNTSTGEKLHDFMQELEDLESDLENAVERGDEQFDRAENLQEELNTFENNEHEDFEVMDRDDYERYEQDTEKFAELEDILAELKDAEAKKELGVPYADERFNEALERLKDFTL